MKIEKLSGKEIKDIRLNLMLTLKEVAKACDIHHTTIHKIETEKSSHHSMSYLKIYNFYKNINVKKLWKYKIERKKRKPKPYSVSGEGKYLQDLRLKHGYSQQEAADEIGITRTTLSHYENNNYDISINTYNKLLELYKTSIKLSYNEIMKIADDKVTFEEKELLKKILSKIYNE